jgi:hypothetical protein
MKSVLVDSCSASDQFRFVSVYLDLKGDDLLLARIDVDLSYLVFLFLYEFECTTAISSLSGAP